MTLWRAGAPRPCGREAKQIRDGVMASFAIAGRRWAAP
jgi:hypothetical protein